MVVVGLLVGFNFSSSPLEVVAGFGLLLLFGYAFSWVFAYVALVSGSAEGANALGFMVIFPLTFASSAFVPPESMPPAIEAFANANPISTIVDATRALFVGTPAGNDVWAAVAWCVGLIAVFGTLSVYQLPARGQLVAGCGGGQRRPALGPRLRLLELRGHRRSRSSRP